ncbi:hypothetical protein CA13_09600 [Planctomycetes bacterium CA13]|uniref:SMI1/KNR4 family protein n=1 Tax=Novipirellula herctigrandis TaxID=2527986 RepID=A0A5C5YXR4_9BACT|nr:hypothetical protein CA13_09600 [Planctomycetes bacterium CA13]
MTPAEIAVQEARQTPLDFGDDVLVFNYTNSDGVEWQGCVEEWIGNEESSPIASNDLHVELDGNIYYQIGSSGGGADILLVRDDDTGTIHYLNDFDQTVSLVSKNVSGLVALLRAPE